MGDNYIKNIINDMKNVKTIYEQDSLSVEEALNIPMIKGCEIIGGRSGLKNRCKHMTILETPEGISWLEGGEFLVTAGYAFYGKDEIKENMILEAYKKGVSAIAIKEMRYFGSISEKLISDSNKYGIPIIKIPYDVVYTDMISNFYYLLFYRKNEYILSLNNIYEKLLNLSFEDKDIDGIIYSLSNLSNSNVFLYDNNLNLVSSNIINARSYNKISSIAPFNKKEFTLFDIENKIVNFEINNSFISVYPILKKEKPIAFIFIVTDEIIGPLEQSSIEYGVSIISIRLKRDRDVNLSQPIFNKTLLEIMLYNKDLPTEFYSNVEKDIGWDKDGNIIGVCIKVDVIDGSNMDNVNYIIHDIISVINGRENYLATVRLNELFILLKLEPDYYLEEVINKIQENICLHKSKFLSSIGVSNSYKGFMDIEKMYNESYLAVLFSNHDIIYFNSLDTIKLLYPLKDDNEVINYYNKTLKKLEIYDESHDINLVETLECFFRYNLNNKIAASKLFIHVETLRYRLNRIEEITGYSTNEAEGIFALQMGIKLRKLIKLK